MSLINQAKRLVSRRFSQVLQVQRQTDTGEQRRLKVRAIVHPTSPSDILLLPESERHLPTIKLFTDQVLKRGDIVPYKRCDYVIKTQANWSDYGYYYHLGVRHLPTAKGDRPGFEIT